MKKGLLLSIVASTVLFAGGDIAPVQPVAEAPAAACNDFYGAAVVGVVSSPLTAAGTDIAVGAVLGVSKELFGGLVVNAEAQGAVAVNAAAFGTFTEIGALTTLNVAYSFGNTAVLAGRWSSNAGSNKDYFGLKKTAHNGIRLVNTDIADTTIALSYSHYKTTGMNTAAAATALEKSINAEITNKSFADTTITLGGDYELIGKTYDVYGNIATKLGAVDLSVGAKYFSTTNYVVGATVAGDLDALHIVLGASRSKGAAAWSKYTDFTGVDATAAIGAKVSTKISGIGLWVGGDYQVAAKTWEAGVGASKTISGISYAVDYRRNSAGANRVRAKAVYKF